MEPASLFITNATRTDTAQYRCEVTAHKDDKIFDEILINLTVRGMRVLCLNFLYLFIL